MVLDKRAIITVPRELGNCSCWDTRLRDVPDERFRQMCSQSAEVWLRNYEQSGFDFLPRYDIHVYGPFPSKVMLEPMLDPDSMSLDEKQVKALIRDKDSTDAFNKYLLVAGFVTKASAPKKEGVTNVRNLA